MEEQQETSAFQVGDQVVSNSASTDPDIGEINDLYSYFGTRRARVTFKRLGRCVRNVDKLLPATPENIHRLKQRGERVERQREAREQKRRISSAHR